MKYNIIIPIANPKAAETPNPLQYSYRKCNVFRTDDVDECVRELAGYILDFFPADVDVEGTTEEEDNTLMEKVAVMKIEVFEKLSTQVVMDEVVSGKTDA